MYYIVYVEKSTASMRP